MQKSYVNIGMIGMIGMLVKLCMTYKVMILKINGIQY